jgi:hypothetical protein
MVWWNEPGQWEEALPSRAIRHRDSSRDTGGHEGSQGEWLLRVTIKTLRCILVRQDVLQRLNLPEALENLWEV